MDHGNAIVLSDLSRCTPAAALSPDRRKFHWLTIPYEAEEISGVMLSTGPETDAPDVTLPLDVSGWHAIFIGLWGMGRHAAQPDAVKVRLSGSPCFTTIAREEPDYYSLDERFWKVADLTDQEIIFGQHSSGFPSSASPAYVKLVPLSAAEVEGVLQERKRRDTRRLIGIAMEGDDFFANQYPTTREEIHATIEPFRDTDFGKLLWCTGGGADVCTYPTKIGMVECIEPMDRPRVIDRYKGESLQILLGKGIDPLAEAVAYAHQVGLELHAQMRMGAWQMCPPFEETYTGKVWREHPEWRCVDIDGRQIARMSLAFPGMQDYVLSLLEELVGYDVDGISLTFVRGAPYVLYEEPLVEGFRQESGLDARDLPEDDKRYLAYRARVMTGFMRRVRQTMDRAAHERGRKIEISSHVLNNEAQNRFYGLDLAAWVEEGLLDTMIPYPWRNEAIDMAYFGQLTRESECLLCPEVMPRRMSPEAYRQRAMGYYAAGADGLCFWDTEGRHPMRAEWSMIRRLGHVEELAAWEDGAGEYYRTLKFRSLGGYAMDKYPPTWAY